MIRPLLLSIVLLSTLLLTPLAQADCPQVLDHDMRKLRSRESTNLCEAYRGKPLLIINTASHCGFTPQFKGLEALHQEYREQGLQVAGFASNSFRQEAKTEEETATMCYVNYGVTFDMYAEIPVKGKNAHPLFADLADAQGPPRWNFTKYLVDSNGTVIARFGSSTTPEDPALRSAIETVLAN